MNDFITNNLMLISSLAVCASITFIAYILHKSASPREGTLIQQDYDILLQSISNADSYSQICNLENEIDEFDYRHNHEVGCAYMLMKLADLYENKKHDILVDISKIANQEVSEVQRTDFIIAN